MSYIYSYLVEYGFDFTPLYKKLFKKSCLMGKHHQFDKLP